MDETEQIRECYRRMYDGMAEKDEAVLREVLTPGFVLAHMTGMRQTLDEFIRAVLDGTLNYASARHQNIAVRLNDSRAELTGQSVVRAAVFGGGWHVWHLQLSCRLVKKDGKWRIAEADASTY